MSATVHAGPIRSRTKETDGEMFAAGIEFMFNTGTWTATRGAAGNWFMRKTAAANTPIAVLVLERLFRKKIGADPLITDPGVPASEGHDIRGYQITAIDIIYKVTTTALNSFAASLNSVLYANNAAPVVAAVGGALSGVLTLTTQAQPYVITLTPATPFIVGDNVQDQATTLELALDAAAGTVFDLYGAMIRFGYNLL